MMAASAVCVAAGTRQRALFWCGAAAVAIAMVTPLVRAAAWVDLLPVWLQWHLRPAAPQTTFTLLPWAGFLFAGAAWGGVASGVWNGSRSGAGIRGLVVTAVAAVALLAIGFFSAARPALYESSSFWTSSPAFFTIRVGVILGAVAVLTAVELFVTSPVPGLDVLERFGRASLFVYWIHVELVYGYATWPIHGRLPLWQALAGWMVMCGLMLTAINFRERLTNRGRNRRIVGTSGRAATI
jgi:hypothetical protein